VPKSFMTSTGCLDHAADTGIATNCGALFGQHEFAGARQRIETRFRKRLELKFSVAIGEIRKHLKTQPVADRFVKGAQDAGLVGVAGMPFEQFFRFFAAIASEICVQQIDHGPKVAAFFNIHLKKIFADRRATAQCDRAIAAARRKQVRCRPG